MAKQLSQRGRAGLSSFVPWGRAGTSFPGCCIAAKEESGAPGPSVVLLLTSSTLRTTAEMPVMQEPQGKRRARGVVDALSRTHSRCRWSAPGLLLRQPISSLT